MVDEWQQPISGIWYNCQDPVEGYAEEHGFKTRQVWVLAEQEKEDDNKHITAEDINKPKSTFISRLTGLKYNEQSTRIAELSARVAELEGVLREIIELNWEEDFHVDRINKVLVLATNALKKNTDGK